MLMVNNRIRRIITDYIKHNWWYHHEFVIKQFNLI